MSNPREEVVYEFQLPITSEDVLLQFVRRAFGVQLPERRVCSDHVSVREAFVDAYFARAPIFLWHGSRGFAGKTFTLALLAATIAATLPCDVNLLGGSGLQSKRALEAAAKLWSYKYAPRHLLAGDLTTTVTRFAAGNSITALMASQRSVRGSHVPRLLLDEIDEMDLGVLDAAMGQTLSVPGIPACTVMSSTWQNPAGTMTELMRRAAERGYPVKRWCFEETRELNGGWLAEDEIERKRYEVTDTMWRTEYVLQEPSHQDRAIDTDKLEAMFNRTLGEFDGTNGEAIEIEGPQPGAQYATGADWARKQDNTVIVTLRTDLRPYRVVAFERMRRLPWPHMIGRFDARVTRYGGAAAHDGTGVGDVVAGIMTSQAEGLIMAGRTRSDLFTEYVAAIEQGEFEAPWITYMRDEHRYADNAALYGSGHPPDSIVAGALALRAHKTRPKPVVHSTTIFVGADELSRPSTLDVGGLR